MTDPSLIFVYGTLRKAFNHPMHQVLLAHSQYVGEGLISGKLYEIAGYPGVIESNNPAETVTGELYWFAKAGKLLSLLDEYEECSTAFTVPYEYLRQTREVQLVTGLNVTAWVYVYNWSTSGRILISSGDYIGFCRDNQIGSTENAT